MKVKKGKRAVKNYPDAAAYLLHEGSNAKSYLYLGAHKISDRSWIIRTWAPNAQSVSVCGDFNGWDTSANPLQRNADNVWEGIIENAAVYDKYKFYIVGADGVGRYKADPYAFHTATRPETDSKLYDIGGYAWEDGEWMKKRAALQPYKEPLNIYELHAGSWKKYSDGNFLSYGALAEQLIPYIKEMGYTHIELMPLTEYPFDGSWGYQVTGYFAPTARYGTPHDFMQFVDAMHEAGIGVILDWVPAHFPKDAHGLYEFDGSTCYEYDDPLKNEHPDWGTRIFAYDKPEVRSFLISSAQFWLEQYHIDGIRVDAVASMLYLDYGKASGQWRPNKHGDNVNLEAVEFIQKLNIVLHKENRGIMVIAEESTSWPLITAPVDVGGLGFDFKWNMGWMNDTLRFMSTDSLFRGSHLHLMTFAMTYAFSENFILPLSHDEVVHGKCSLLNKMPGEYDDKFANLRAYYGFMFAHPGKKLLFMGSEFGQFIEWNENQELDWLLLGYEKHYQLREFVKALCALYQKHKPLSRPAHQWEGFQWIAADDTRNCVLSCRLIDEKGEEILFIANFSGRDLSRYRIGVPKEGTYQLLLSSDEPAYGGSGSVKKSLRSSAVASHGFDQSCTFTLPKFSAQFYRRRQTRRTSSIKGGTK